ncbi:UDP-galactopyranose mutase [Arcicella rosea]|uniref:UDP-galactopyranose mutase n=1 Tax=Arcicella rosea TaxID=502909 RepID=A0A841EK51_9BACT|nr:UDP-galactopyranose mutase [Arcicella rosea]MBB6004557.1 UDP-galactopyranose mutase [Arcicella rosea]
MKQYDFVIVGAGLFGAVFAHEANKRGKKCLVIDKRTHLGGNIYCEEIEGINVHKYGAHIFHTNDKAIWDYVNSFVEFNRYTNSPLANFEGELYNLPFNMNTFYQLWKVKTPQEAQDKINEQVAASGITDPQNLEEQAISLVGTDIYHKLIKGYTEKQWGRKATELPAFIIKRLPLRFTFDNNYFNDKYQGIPIGGYNKLTEGLLKGIEVKTSTDFFANREAFQAIADKIVFTGHIDEYYDYCFGKLEYRSLRFENEVLDQENYQGNAVVNYTEADIPFTRIIEHKHFEFGKQSKTVVTKEYPCEWDSGMEAYYPINDDKNTEMFKRYRTLASEEKEVIFGGRLAEYKYYDMHQVVASALVRVKSIFG